MSFGKWLLGFPVALSLGLFTTAALGEPYQIEARYTPKDKTSNATVVYATDTVDVIPSTTDAHSFDGIFFRFKSDDIAKASLANLRNFVYNFKFVDGSGGLPAFKSIPAVSAEGKEGVQLVGAEDLLNSSVHALKMEVRAKPTRAYLCGQEMEVRKAADAKLKDWTKEVWALVKADVRAESKAVAADDKKANPKGAAAKTPAAEKSPDAPPDVTAMTPSQLVILTTLVAYPLKDKTLGAVLYSFCSTEENELIDWVQVGKNMSPAVDAEKAREAHKKAVLVPLLPYLTKVHKETAHYGADAAGYNENVYFSNEHTVLVIHNLKGKLKLNEKGVGKLGMQVDQDAVVQLTMANEDACKVLGATCDDALFKHLKVYVEGEDTKGKQVKKVVNLVQEGAGYKLDVALRDFLYKKIQVRTHFQLGKEELTIRTDQTQVENFGLVHSFPVITEVWTLAGDPSKVNARDLEAQSSIPVAWAFNTSANDGKHGAVMLPYMIGYNPRWAPRLANYVRIFPHLSLILPLDNTAVGGATANSTNAVGTPQLALGAGINLATMFSFAWGTTVDTGAHYFFVGVGINDLGRLMLKAE
ncbi:MAG: hypothetical protein IPK82_16420 [Polyangiaceae bacterium]|nr:hypothetical protein [Polyangiaceae bacterium]